jgi:hypothetical protein
MSKHRETGHIVERSPGRWAIVISVKDATTGKRKRQWHSFQGTKREAAQERIRLLATLNHGTALEPNKTSLAKYLDQWLGHIRPSVSPRTAERYCQVPGADARRRAVAQAHAHADQRRL